MSSSQILPGDRGASASGGAVVAPPSGGPQPFTVPVPLGTGTLIEPGMPVTISINDVGGVVHASTAAGRNHPDPLGIAGGSNGGLTVFGPLTLSPAEWEARTGTTGGLTPGATYYCGPALGSLSTIPAGARVGYAESATTLFVQCGRQPCSLGLPAGVANVGLVVQAADNPAGFSTAVASSLAACQNTVGILIETDDADNGVAWCSGEVVTQTTDAWDDVTGQSGGLTPGSIYYLSSTSAGHLTTVAPVASGTCVVQVGIAMSATELFLQVTPPFAANP